MAEERVLSELACPRCKTKVDEAAMSPYRRSGRSEGLVEPFALVRLLHRTGVEIFACEGCGGHFVSYEGMIRLESSGRGSASAEELARRTYEKPREPISCVKCGGDTTRRRWGAVSSTFVDVCDDYDCRGVWLDEGELEAIAGRD